MTRETKLICPETKKHWHASRGAARAHLRSLQAYRTDEGTRMSEYHCEFCGGWHVGRLKGEAHRDKYKD